MRTSLVTRTSAGALTAAMAAVPAVCQAQSFQATPSVAFGTVTIDQSVANTTTVTVDSNRAIVDWTRSDLPGTTQFTFQPAGTTANFVKGSGAGAAPYAILNRIASTEASASALFDGTVNDVSGGNSIFFYNSGGFVLGANSRFNVGNLVLSAGAFALDGASDFFPGSSQFSVASAAGSNAGVEIQAGAQINSSVAGSQSFVVAVAPKITQAGAITTAGSSALVAAEAAAFQFTAGLFDITVSSGTDVGGNALTHSGSTGGSASSGAGDYRRVYLVAVPKNTALTMAIGGGGQLGFDVAGAADVVGNTIVLSAGHNVVATAAGDPLAGAPVTAANADIRMNRGNYTSNLIARSNNITEAADFVAGGTPDMTFESDVSLRGRTSATAFANQGTVAFGGNLTVDASQASFTADAVSHTGGNAMVRNATGTTLTVAGNLTVLANGTGGDRVTGATQAGSGFGGSARLIANGTLLSVTGTATVRADGLGGNNFTVDGTGNGTGGTALVQSAVGGTLNLNSGVTISADGIAGLNGVTGVDGGSGFGGLTQLLANSGNAAIVVTGSANLSARGVGAPGFNCTTCSDDGGNGTGG